RDANALLYKYTGLKLPINELNFWLLGIPAPDKPIKLIQLNQNRLLTKLIQDDWQIEYKRYNNVNNTRLPGKIFIENHAFDVRLIMQRWITQ
ncbi:MAG: lipoprotein insertase outer membrane protein LolB, partial [Gammaproteobacteria bacterium]|nr:lipoprotein insertase outer membrane protein LolB [Gammaproteobacteria bacterium]